MKHLKKYLTTFFTMAVFFIISTANSALAYTPDFKPCCLQATSVSNTEIDLTWTPIGNPNPAISGFKIERENGIGNGFTTIIANTNSTAASYADTNLSPGATYNYRVSSINSDGAGPASDPAAATTASVNIASVPAAPANLIATPASASKIDLSWSTPTSTSPILGYRIEREVSIGGGFTTIVSNSNSIATTYSDTNLSPGVVYNYRVYALNASGPSPYSISVNATTPMQPNAPLNPIATAGDGQAIISWIRPTFTAGGINSYTITSVPLNANASSSAINISSSTTSAIISGLVNGIQYYFYVNAVNLAGTSQPAITNTIMPIASPLPQAQAATSIMQTTTASPAYIFTSTIQIGMRGKTVLELQKRLIKAGYLSGTATGYFGALTKAALKAYQRSHQITQTGMLGPITRASLNSPQ